MPPAGQGQSWSDILCCVVCSQVFSVHRHPVNLTCGHVVCKQCLQPMSRSICPIDEIEGMLLPSKYPPNTALLHIVTGGRWRETLADWQGLDPSKTISLRVIDTSLKKLASFLSRAESERGGTVYSEVLSRTMQRKLVSLLCFQLMEEEGRSRALKTCRAMADRVMTEILLSQQVASHLSTQLWTAVRSRGCQFLGPAMQEDVLRLILLALGSGAPIARKTLVMYVVQMLTDDYPQVSKTCVGHVVQLLYRASCFHVLKREGESSLMQLKEEFRTYDCLRREHDMQIVQMALEAGLRICPDQWSALLYGDQQHRSHMQSIIDKLQSLQSYQQGMDELAAIATKGDELVGNMLPLLAGFNCVHPTHHERVSWERFADFLSNLSTLIDLLVQHSTRRQERRSREPKDSYWKGRHSGGGSGNTTQNGASPQKYKTKMCRDVMLGHTCPRGTRCTWAHSHDEIQEARGRSNNNNLVGQTYIPMGQAQQNSAHIPVGMSLIPQQHYNSNTHHVPAHSNGLPPPPSEPLPMVPIAVHHQHQHAVPMQPMLLMSSQATPSPLLMGTAPRQQSTIWQTQTMILQPTAPAHNSPAHQQPAFWISPNPPLSIYPMDNAISPPSTWGRPESHSKSDQDPDQLFLKRKEILSRLAPFSLVDDDDCENDGGIGHVSYTVASSVLDERELQFPFRGPPPLELPPIPVSYAPVLPTVPTEESMMFMGDIAAIQARPRAPSLPMIQVTTVLTACPGGLLSSEGSKPATVQAACSEMHVRDSMNQPLATAIIQDSQGSTFFISTELSSAVVPVVPIETATMVSVPPVVIPTAAVSSSLDPQNVVSNTLDRIVDVKERLSEATNAPVPCAVSQQLREELRIAEREMDSLDPRTQASCLLKELEQVDREIERMELSRPVDCQQPFSSSINE